MKELHLTEGRNTGIRKILNALERNGSPLPEFITDEDHSYFITRLFIRDGFEDVDDDIGIENDIVNGVVKHAPGTAAFIKSISGNKQKTAIKIVLEILKDNRQTIQQIADGAGISKRTAARYISEFQDADVLKREGSDKSGKWILL